jgi:hypothetical protein
MELDLLGNLFGLLLHVDLTCSVCNWDPATNSWIPAAGTAAAGTGLGLNDLFGPNWDLPQLPYPPYDPTGGTPHPEDAGGPDSPGSADSTPGGPVDPHRFQNEEVGLHNTSDVATTDAVVEAYEAEQQRLRDYYRATHPGATTAPPVGPSSEEQASGFFWRAMNDIGKH